MIFSIYFIKKIFNALIVCGGISYAIFFIFSLIGNLGESFSFSTILHLSALNSLQIIAYIPSHLFILSFCLIVLQLKSKNELIIIKEYIELKKLLLIVFPILILFVFIELKKETFSTNIEKTKSNLLNTKNLEETKIFILSDGNKKKFYIFSEFNLKEETINQYLGFEVEKQKINKGEISKNLNLHENNLYSKNAYIYENNDFRFESINKKLFDNFTNFWSQNTKKIIKTDNDNINSSYNFVQSIFFHIFFYFCISIIFLNKELVKRNANRLKIFFLILALFIYHLLIPKIMLENFHLFFHAISLTIFIIIFFKTTQYE